MRKWDWKGSRKGDAGVATFCVGPGEVRLALPDFRTAYAISEMIEDAHHERSENSMIDWQPVETIPHDGRMVLVYRPLAARTNDDPIAIKRTETENRWCWPTTVPDGATPTNPTNGACHVTHWAALTAPSNNSYAANRPCNTESEK